MTRVLIGDVLDKLCDIEPASIQCIVTSPPYWKLRKYGECSTEIGREPTVDAYIERLCAVGDVLMDVLAPTGTFWLNIGDTFDDELRLIPHRLAIQLSNRGWYVRMDNVWKKTRYMPNGGKNRSVLIHEYVFQFTKRPSNYYYYNADAIREPHSPVSLARWKSSGVAALGAPHSMGHKQADGGYQTRTVIANPLGKLKASVWDICPSNYKGPHYAVMPERLAETCILASTRPGDTVLDPFCGSGTTGKMAVKHGRSFIGIDNDPRNEALTLNRIQEAM